MVKCWRFLALALIFFILVFSFSVQAQTYDKGELAKTLFQFALNLYYKGSLDQAAEEFKKIIESFPESPYAADALYWLAKYYQTQDNYELAFKNLSRIIDQYPQTDQAPAAYYELGNLLSNLKNPLLNLEKARVHYLKMVTLYPQHPQADSSLLAAAKVSFLLDDYASGIEDARRVLLRHPQDKLGAEAQWLVIKGYLRLGYELQALKECQALRDQFPQEKLALAAKNLATQIYRYLIKKTYDPAEVVAWQASGEKPAKVVNLKVDAQGNILLLDRQQGTLIYNPKGKLQSVLGGKGGLPQELQEASALALDEENNVYILDGGNATIYKFSPTGKLMGVLPIRNANQEHPKGASALVVSPMGVIWVADVRGGKIWELDEKGKFMGVWGKAIDKEEDLDQPADLALDRRGFLWVLDKGTKRIYKFNAQKKLVAKAGKGILSSEGKEIIFDNPLKFALDDLCHVFILDGGSVFGKGGTRITQLDDKMNVIQEILNPKGETWELKDPTALDLDHQGRIWVSDADRKGAVIFQ